MGSENYIVFCSQCGTKNRIPHEKWGERAVCGRCRAVLPYSIPFPDGPVEVFDWNFQREVLDFPGPVLLEFYAPWCGHCQRLAPVLRELASEFAGRLKIAQLNIDQNPHTASRYNIRGTPSLFFIKKGRILEQVSGALPKEEIRRRFQSIL